MEFIKISDKYEIIYSNNVTKPSYQPLQLHYHDVLELNFITNGNCTFFIDEKSYSCQKDDILIIPAGVLHKMTYSSEHHSCIIIYCKKHHIPYPVISYLKQFPYLYRNPNILNELTGIMQHIEKEFNLQQIFCDDVLLTYVHQLFYLFARNLNTITPTGHENGHIKDILQYLQKNYSQKITLENLSEEFSFSTEHISRLFKKETGFNFIEYLAAVRMHEAEKLLLLDKKLPITEIAFKCGFNDSNYFSKCFRNVHNCSPSEFRKGKSPVSKK